MARLHILTAKEIDSMFARPRFTQEEREAYLTLTSVEQAAMNEYRHSAVKIYFVLQLGYFKARTRFFTFGLEEVPDDVMYVVNRYFPTHDSISGMALSKTKRLGQQDHILSLL